MADAAQIYKEGVEAADAYINDLLAQAQGDRDFAIRQLKREHDLALGTDDAARAQFLESVADKLEERVGRIPYDYQVATTRTGEDFTRTMEVAGRNRDTALNRLAEDEKVWKQEQKVAGDEAKVSQQEALLKRGILSGTRAGAEGLAGSEVKKLDTELTKQLEAYDRALGRQKSDIGTEYGDIAFGAQRENTRTLQDLKTGARRGAIDTQDTYQFGTEAQNRKFEAQKKELERLRAKEKSYAAQFGAAYI